MAVDGMQRRKWRIDCKFNALSISLCALLLIFSATSSADDEGDAIRCGACRLFVIEMERKIASVDPSKTVKVGSYRVDPKGNQKLNHIPFARSEEHLHDLLEEICKESLQYGMTEHPVTGRLAAERTKNPENKEEHRKFPHKMDNTPQMQNRLQWICESLIEEHEDELLEIFSSESQSPLTKFCVQSIDACTEEDLIEFPVEYEPIRQDGVRVGDGSEELDEDFDEDFDTTDNDDEELDEDFDHVEL